MKTEPSFPLRLLRVLLPAWLAAIVMVLVMSAFRAEAGEPQPVLIGSPGMARIDAATAARLYTGRTIEVGGRPVNVVNAPVGAPLRHRFLALVLQQDDEQYRAYWTVRRHVGKGAPPRELATSADVIAYVSSTPGAIGYVDATELRPGLNVLLRP
jgi:ABC-type phosphate transport system substrate-binding protein